MRAFRAAAIVVAMGLSWVACSTVDKADTNSGGGTTSSGTGGTTSSGTGGTTSSGTGGTTSSGTGGTTSSGTGGSTSSGGGGGQGGAGGSLPTCDQGDCDLCAQSQCADAYCDADMQACVADPECPVFDSCYSACGDATCVGACEAAYPSGAASWYGLVNCYYCSSCAQDCTQVCPIDPVGPGSCDEGDCGTCAGGDCAGAVCDVAIRACVDDQECLYFDSCYGGCNDDACVGTCEAQYPAGSALWYAAVNCLYCDAATCSQDCDAGCPIDAVGAQSCDGGTCGTCVQSQCTQNVCDTQLQACFGSADCADFDSCYVGCGDDACIAACEQSNQVGANLWYAAVNCLYCGAGTCSQDCANFCPVDPQGPLTCDRGDCDACSNSQCTSDYCDPQIQACVANDDCVELYNCVGGCPDQACITQCYGSFPNGETDFDAVMGCLLCDTATCSVDCAGACPWP